MDRVFLDANILFAAAHRVNAGVRRLWRLDDVELITCRYAGGEAQRNLMDPDQQEGLRPLEQEKIDKLSRYLALLRMVRVIEDAVPRALPQGIVLPEKDQPILLSALDAHADFLITADKKHFGPYFGRRIEGTLILPPAEFLKQKSAVD